MFGTDLMLVVNATGLLCISMLPVTFLHLVFNAVIVCEHIICYTL